MAVAFLQMLSKIYSAGVIDSTLVAICTFLLNGLAIYTAFHEIAQLNIAKQLAKKGFSNIKLEYFIQNKGEADVVAQRTKKYVWEVKPLGTSPERQLAKYTNKTGLLRGYNIGTIKNIRIIGKLKMEITFDNKGGAYYAFYIGTKRIKNVELYNAIRSAVLISMGAALAIIIVTIVEDIGTFGIGIWNDGPSFAAAGTVAAPIIELSINHLDYFSKAA